MILKTGQIVDGKYEILGSLGRGGMGSVFKARHIELDRMVALKFMEPHLSLDGEWLKRFEREAGVLYRLAHKSVSRFFHYGICENGSPYIAMEMVEGKNLAEWIADEINFGEEECIQIGVQLAEAFSYIHSHDLVHRDIKPENVILESCNGKFSAKIVDFGLSKEVNSNSTLTRTGQLVGSPLTMSPEQCIGTKADVRSDVYSLGCLMFMLASGVEPFVSDNAIGLIYKHINEEPPIPRSRAGAQLSEDFCQVVLKMLEKDPRRRFQSMDEVIDAFLAIQSTGTTVRSARISSRSIIFYLLAGIAVLAIIVGTLGFNTAKEANLLDQIAHHERLNEQELEFKAVSRLISKETASATDKVDLAASMLRTALALEQRDCPVASLSVALQAYDIEKKLGSSKFRHGKSERITFDTLDLLERLTLASDTRFRSLMKSMPVYPPDQSKYVRALLQETKLGAVSNIGPEIFCQPLFSVWCSQLCEGGQSDEVQELLNLLDRGLKPGYSGQKEYLEFLLDLSYRSGSKVIYNKAKDRLQKFSGSDEGALWSKAGRVADALTLSDDSFRSYQHAYSCASSRTEKAFYAVKLSQAYLSKHDMYRAESLAKESVRSCGQETFFFPLAKSVLGDCFLMQRKLSAAMECYKEAVYAWKDSYSFGPEFSDEVGSQDMFSANYLYPAVGLQSIYELQQSRLKANELQTRILKYVADTGTYQLYKRRLLELEGHYSAIGESSQARQLQKAFQKKR